MPVSTLRVALRGALVSLAFITPVSAQSWQQTLTGGTTSAHDHFGTSLASSEGELLAGTPRDDTTGTMRGSGSVTVFSKSDGPWSETASLLSPSPVMDGNFGTSLSLDGARLLAGAPGEDSLAAPATGAVHIFEQTGGGWSFAGSLEGTNLAPGDRFGYAVSLDGEFAAVGVPGREHDGWNTGCVVIFRETTSGWVEDARLFPPAGSSGARFGHALALEGGTLVVGAPEHSAFALAIGAAFVYSRGPRGGWSNGAPLTPTEGAELQRFGAAVSINSSMIVIGGPGSYAPFGDSMGPQSSGSNGPPRGVAWAYQEDGGEWVASQRLRAPAGEAGDLFGQHLWLSADRLSVSAGGRQTSSGGEGATLLFERSGAGWFLTDEVVNPSPTASLMFGAAAAHHGDEIFVSGIFDGTQGEQAGCVQVFQAEGERHQSCFGELCPCGNSDSLAGCANSTGSGAELFALGSPSLIEDDLVIGVSGLPPRTPVLVFYSSGATQAFFGDGILCVGSGGLSGVGRLERARRASPEGEARWGPGLFSNPGLASFADRLHLQAIYRDPSGTCGAGVNLSNALEFQSIP